MTPRSAVSEGLIGEAQRLRRWLLDVAFPLWWQVGADHVNSGWHERIDFNGLPVALPKRSRVAARQVFCYCEAGRLGWQGPWREAASHALSSLRDHFVRSDGTVIAALSQDATTADERFDLYNQAFALLAYAHAHQMIDRGGGWRAPALALIGTLERDYRHPEGGFYEDRDGRGLLRANPHMHLLEAALAWLPIDPEPIWRRSADMIAALCLDRFMGGESGVLREHFSTDWAPLPGPEGQIVEPGHHYEWAFLLDRWARLTGRERPAAVAKLIAFADRHGVDRGRNVAVNAITTAGHIHDPVARLWPQTERLRAYIIDDQADSDARLQQAIAALWRYLNAPLSGLWYENQAANGQFVIEAAPATSLYHIVGALVELWTAFGVERGIPMQRDR
jgi:mannose/cellobiose epimerase-like protein (N-acyl-D-glucosamine 2-epimerase family)